jgi:hypothetical protein
VVDPAERIAQIEDLLESAIYREDVADGVGLTWSGLKTWLYRQHQGALGMRVGTLPLRERTPTTEKPCKNCGQTMSRREGESTNNWSLRSTCGRSCHVALVARRRAPENLARRRAPENLAVRATNRVQLTGDVSPGVHILHHASGGATVTCSRCRYGFPKPSAKAARKAKALHERVDCLRWIS